MTATAPPLTAARSRPHGNPVPTAVSRARGAAVWNAAATTVIWLTSLSVLALWVHGGGIEQTVTLGADGLNALGRLAALVSANLLLYQALLMARVPLFERGFGRDGITRMHRLVGFWSFVLLGAHILLQVLGYALAAGVSAWSQLWQFIWDYPGMLLATAATLLLVLVVVTSVRRARRRLRYESWHLLHLYAYLGIGLAIPHMLWTGSDFIEGWAAAYWWILWGGTAAAILLYRIALPLLRSLRHDLRVAEVRADGARGVTLRLRGRDLHRLGARSGQFFIWRFLDGPGWTRAHPLSLSASPHADEWQVTAQIVGDGTRRMAALRPGTRVLFEGPYGTLTADRRQARKLLMLGAGAGVAPLVSLLQSEPYAPGEATLVTRESSTEDALLQPAIAELVARRGLRAFSLPGPRHRGAPGWVPATHGSWDGAELLRMLAPDLAEHDVYLCGPQAWMDAVRADLARAGVHSSHIHHESFTV